MKSKLPGKKAKPPVPKESFGLPGKTYKTPSNAVKTTSLLKQNKTKRLAGMQGQSNFKKRSNSEVLGMAINMASTAGLSKLAAKQLIASANRASSARVYARATETSNAGAASRIRASKPYVRTSKPYVRTAKPSPPKAPPSRSLTDPYRPKPTRLKPPAKLKLKETPKLTPTRQKVVNNPVNIKTNGKYGRVDPSSASKVPQIRRSATTRAEQYGRLQRETPRIKPPLKTSSKPPLKALPKPPKR